METESLNTRFCLVCNYLSKIISPIISRCSKFRFNPHKNETLTTTMDLILEKEGIEFPQKDKLFEIIYKESKGDLRRAVNILQNACSIVKYIGPQSQDMSTFLGVNFESFI